MQNFTPLLRGYGKYRAWQLEQLSPIKSQETTLLQLVKKASQTRFGRDHFFSSITSVQEYQRRVPLRTYEQFWSDYWKPAFPTLIDCTWPGKIPYFPVSSGTSSGTTKYIPCTHETLRSNTKAGLDLLLFHLAQRPSSQLFGGLNFFLGGSTDLKGEAPGVLSGDLSGITALNIPWWAKPRYFPPPELALMKNWEEKITVLARESLSRDIRMISGVPSWLLIFFDTVQKISGKTGAPLHECYPNLELVVHGGVNFSPYKKRFQELLTDSHAELREVYPASEGFIAVADRGYGEGLRLNVDHNLFFEFVPLEELSRAEPTRHWGATIELDVNYAVVLTTCSGLFSYILGDTVRFVERQPPRLLVTGRISYSLSSFGEHLIGEEIEDALSLAAEEAGIQIDEYSVGTIFPTREGELGGHLYIVESRDPSPLRQEQALQQFASTIDSTLQRRNEDYQGHRAEGFGLKPPAILLVAPGSFAAWMEERGKLGGQNKVPRIIQKEELFSQLCSYMESHHRVLATWNFYLPSQKAGAS